MDKNQAWEILRQVSQVIKGTVQEHQTIYQALEALKPVSITSPEIKKPEVKGK